MNLIIYGIQVCALLSGGGYAEKVAVPAGQVLSVPQGVSLKEAASFPEVASTVWSAVSMMSRLSAGDTFLVISKPTFYFFFSLPWFMIVGVSYVPMHES